MEIHNAARKRDEKEKNDTFIQLQLCLEMCNAKRENSDIFMAHNINM